MLALFSMICSRRKVDICFITSLLFMQIILSNPFHSDEFSDANILACPSSLAV